MFGHRYGSPKSRGSELWAPICTKMAAVSTQAMIAANFSGISNDSVDEPEGLPEQCANGEPFKKH